MTAFSDGEARRGLAEGTMKSLWSRLYRLYLFLTDKGADTFSMVTRDMINDFIKYLAPYSTTYVSENLRMLRRLSLYAFQNGYHAEDLSGCIPAVKNSRQQKLPAVFSEDEVEKSCLRLTGKILWVSGTMPFFCLPQGWGCVPAI